MENKLKFETIIRLMKSNEKPNIDLAKSIAEHHFREEFEKHFNYSFRTNKSSTLLECEKGIGIYEQIKNQDKFDVLGFHCKIKEIIEKNEK